MLLESKQYGNRVEVTAVREVIPDSEEELPTSGAVSLAVRGPLGDKSVMKVWLTLDQVDDLITMLEYMKLTAKNKI